MACGTSYHAGLVGKQVIEAWARLPVDIDVASEFRYRNPIIDDKTLIVAITQSGETADTLAGVREAQELGVSIYAGEAEGRMDALLRDVWNGQLKPGPLELGFDYYFGVPVVNSHPPFVYVENHRVVGLAPDDPETYYWDCSGTGDAARGRDAGKAGSP